MTGILGQLKWESLKKRRKDNRLILLYKGLKGKASVPTDDLIPKTRRCRNQHSMAFQTPLPIQILIKVASSPRLSGIGMPSPILWSHPLKMQRIVLLSSLLGWELGTNSLITGPGEWLSFRRFTSKLSWSWSPDPWSWRCYHITLPVVMKMPSHYTTHGHEDAVSGHTIQCHEATPLLIHYTTRCHEDAVRSHYSLSWRYSPLSWRCYHTALPIVMKML